MCRRAACGLVLTAALTGVVAGQEPPTFSESAAVTAFDLVLEIEAGRLSSPSTRRGVGLEAADLELSVDGQPVGAESLQPGAILEKSAPLGGDDAWSILVWLAADLASDYQLRWAAATLAQLTEELVALGEVEIVQADPEPRTLLAPSRDAALLETALSRLAVGAAGADRLAGLRHDYVVERNAPTLELPPAAVEEAFADEEERIVLAHEDALLLAIDGRRDSSRRRRLLLLVSGGFDLPRCGESDATTTETSSPEGTACDETDSWLRSIAAFGWITAPLLAPRLDHPLRGGFTIGKLRLYFGGPPGTVGFHGPWEGDRDPERAAAYVRLGRSLRDQGRLEEAEEAFRRALFHYYDDAKTAVEQGVAWLELGDILSRLGEGSEALLAWQLGAGRLCASEEGGTAKERRRGRTDGEATSPPDPCVDVELPVGAPSLDLLLATRFEREAVLEDLAQMTSGSLLRDEPALRNGLRALAERPRLVFQLPALPSGRLLQVDLRSRRPALDLRYPRALRSGSPERLATARLRHLLARGPLEGDRGLVIHGAAGGGAYLIELPPSTASEPPIDPGPVRLSWAWLDGEDVLVRHTPATIEGESGAWRLQGPPLPSAPAAAVMVEVLPQERWGAAILELEE